MKLTVIGTGYLGATHAACMAELGHDVLGVDTDAGKIAELSQGRVPFYEPGLEEILERNIASGRLRFTTDYAEAADFASVHFVGVGTPQMPGSHAADTRYVEAVIDDLTPLLRGGHVFLGKSTVPVGTAAELERRAATRIADDSATVRVAWNPEFLREGHAVEDTLRPDRIVLGVDGDAEDIVDCAKEIYSTPLSTGSPFLVMDRATAELVKISANAFLATKISFINAVSEVCEAAGADVTRLAQAIGLDDRIGPKFLGAGLGFGGGCLPKDIRAFGARAHELGVGDALHFLREIDAINLRRREAVVTAVSRFVGGALDTATVAVLGAAFKPNSDDVRDSPALDVAAQLHTRGATTRVFDPKAMDNARARFPRLDYCASTTEALTGADVVVVATEWQEFRDLDPVAARGLVAAEEPVVIDARNCLSREQWEQAGWTVYALGRGPLPPALHSESHSS